MGKEKITGKTHDQGCPAAVAGSQAEAEFRHWITAGQAGCPLCTFSRRISCSIEELKRRLQEPSA